MINKFNKLAVMTSLLVCVSFSFLSLGISKIEAIQAIAQKSVLLSRVIRGTESEKLAFMNSNFCTDERLLELAASSEDDVEVSKMLSDLSRDCVVTLDLLHSDKI